MGIYLAGVGIAVAVVQVGLEFPQLDDAEPLTTTPLAFSAIIMSIVLMRCAFLFRLPHGRAT